MGFSPQVCVEKMDFLGDFLNRKWTFGENIDNFGVRTPRTYNIPLDCFEGDGLCWWVSLKNNPCWACTCDSQRGPFLGGVAHVSADWWWRTGCWWRTCWVRRRWRGSCWEGLMDVSSPPHVSPLMGCACTRRCRFGRGPVPRQSLLQCHPTY